MDRVNQITGEVFNALTQIRHASEQAETMPDVLHGRMRSFVERSMRRAVELGLNQQDAHDIGYVLAALVDEVMLSKSERLRDFWLPNVLQLQLFNENIAGEAVFERLQVLMQDGNRIDVLHVYYLVLLFGFQGKYRVRGGEIELADLTDRVAGVLARAGKLKEVEISPEGARPRERGDAVRRSLPLIGISIAAVVVSVIVFVALYFSVSSNATDVVQTIQDALKKQ